MKINEFIKYEECAYNWSLRYLDKNLTRPSRGNTLKIFGHNQSYDGFKVSSDNFFVIKYMVVQTNKFQLQIPGNLGDIVFSFGKEP